MVAEPERREVPAHELEGVLETADLQYGSPHLMQYLTSLSDQFRPQEKQTKVGIPSLPLGSRAASVTAAMVPVVASLPYG